MPSMSETDEAPTGFDRRSLIKKGLVAGSIAATMPVISTFNAPVFAASVPGLHRLKFHKGLLGDDFDRVTPSNAGCGTSIPNWGDADNGAVVTASATGPSSGVYTFALTGSYASCEIIGAAASTVNALVVEVCLGDAGTGFSGVGTNTVTFTADLLDALLGANVYLLVSC
jgi:hypothetical protein